MGHPGGAVLAWIAGLDLLRLGPGCGPGVRQAIRTAAARAVADGDLPVARLTEAAGGGPAAPLGRRPGKDQEPGGVGRTVNDVNDVNDVDAVGAVGAVDAVEAVRETDVAVIGAGQAGLSAAYFLRRAGMLPGRDFVVLDHSPVRAAPGSSGGRR